MKNKTKKIQLICITSVTKLLDVLKKMDELEVKLLVVLDDDLFKSVVSIGDIQRALIKNIPLHTPVAEILRDDVEVANEFDNIDIIKSQMIATRTECMPVISKEGKLLDVIFWDELYANNNFKKESINLPVVIMAGGKGTRLKPLTNIIPKPLIPIGNTTIVEEIINKFSVLGCDYFYISVNYKSEMISNYLDSKKTLNRHIHYFEEKKPLGTAGSMYLLKNKIKQTFFVTNCDILIDQDLSEVYSYHKSNKNEITIIAALKHYSIPYGTIKTKENGILEELIEKPELTFWINSGMYILEPHLLDLIPDNKFFHITELIDIIKKRGGRIGVFPVSQGAWKDIGEWKGYLNLINK